MKLPLLHHFHVNSQGLSALPYKTAVGANRRVRPPLLISYLFFIPVNMTTNNSEEFEGDSSLENHETDYPNLSIKLVKEQFSLFELKRRYEIRKTIVLDPDFQRNQVWDTKQNCELIESILMGIPIPPIYLFENKEGIKQVVDGRQRLTCFFDYLNNRFKLVGLKMLTGEQSKKCSDLMPLLQAKIEDYQILAYTIQYPTAEKVKFDIFDRVNRGGTRLNNQEMRHALYFGKATELLKKLSQLESFLAITGISAKRMKDQYLILRFLGFYLLKTHQLGDLDYKNDIDDFLAAVMTQINGYTDTQILELEKIFILAMTNCYQVLGNHAYRFDSSKRRRPINMGLFDSLSYALALPLPENINLSQLKQSVESLKAYMDQSKLFTGSIDTRNAVKYRFDKADKIRMELSHV